MFGPHHPEVKYCRRCWREDVLKPAHVSNFKFACLIGFSCGLVLLVWPYKCVTCGVAQIDSWIRWRELIPNRFANRTQSTQRKSRS